LIRLKPFFYSLPKCRKMPQNGSICGRSADIIGVSISLSIRYPDFDPDFELTQDKNSIVI